MSDARAVSRPVCLLAYLLACFVLFCFSIRSTFFSHSPPSYFNTNPNLNTNPYLFCCIFILVLMNDDKNSHTVTIEVEGEALDVTLPAISFATLVVQV